MKQFSNNVSSFVKLVAILLAVAICFTGCNGGEATSSDDSVDTSVVEQTDSKINSGEGETASEQTGSKQNGTADQNSSNTSTGTTVAKKTTWEKDYLSNIPDSVKKKEIHVLMWREYTSYEQKVIDAFKKKTGIKIRTTVIPEDQYSVKLLSLISGKDSPDVVAMESNNFPTFVVKALQSLDEEVFRLNDPIWSKDYMNAYKANGKYFTVAIPGSYSVEDCLYTTYYNPLLLKSAGVTTMPYDLYKQGKWNWDTQKEVLNKLVKAGTLGMSLQSEDLFMLSAGVEFVDYNGTEFVNNLSTVNNNSLLTKTWSHFAELKSNSCLETIGGGWGELFAQGKVGMVQAIVYGMLKENSWFKDIPIGLDNVNCVPLAAPKGQTAYVPVRPKTWGVALGADNVEGAAYFLRYFLDPANYEMDSLYCNKQMKEVFNILSSSKNKKVRYSYGVVNYLKANTYAELLNELEVSNTANIIPTLNKKKGNINTAVKRCNSEIKRVK